MIKKAALAFLVTFCTPAILIASYKTYAATGRYLGKFVYEATHENS